MVDSGESSFLNHKENDSEHSKKCTTENEKSNDDKTEKSEQNADSDKNVEKREKLETQTNDEPLKRQKSDHSTESTFLDIIKSVVKEDGSDSGFNILTNTKEYDCPIAKLARMNPGDCFFKVTKSEDTSTNSDSAPETTEDPTDVVDNKETQVVLESSMSENEKLLQEIKECKLSVYRDSEWTMPVPVVTHLILNKDSSNKRVVCFQFGTGKLLLNTVLLPSMSFNKLKNKSIIFSGQTLGDNSTMVPHRLVFSDSSVRDEFHELYSK